jgi:uncharacterized protein YkwD
LLEIGKKQERRSQEEVLMGRKLGGVVAAMCVLTAVVMVLFVGCGVDSGARDGYTPSYTGGPAPGLPGGGNNPGSNPGNAGQGEQEVFDMVNEEREKAGVSPLSWCDGLGELAGAHSCDMCDRNFFDHTNPEGEGPSERGQAGHAGSYTFDPVVPSPYRWVGENIAMGYSSPEQVMSGWMSSSGHRANILNGSYTHIGVGVCDGCGRHWTQCFGTRSGSTGGGTPPSGGGGGGKG